jgi:hypothetical protein
MISGGDMRRGSLVKVANLLNKQESFQIEKPSFSLGRPIFIPGSDVLPTLISKTKELDNIHMVDNSFES